MKKFYIGLLIIVLLLIPGSMICAEERPNIPPVDSEQAKDFLGQWYPAQICDEDHCINAVELGEAVSGPLTLAEDNTASFSENEKKYSWYFEDNAAHILWDGDEALNGRLDNGTLFIQENGRTLRFSREETASLGSANPKADSTLDDFLGKWVMYKIGTQEKLALCNLAGIDGSVDIHESNFDLVFCGMSTEAIPFTFDSAAQSIKLTSPDRNQVQNTITMSYLEDNTLSVSFLSNANGTPTQLLFVREDVFQNLERFMQTVSGLQR